MAKPSIAVIRAALERHNKAVDHTVSRFQVKMQDECFKEIEPLLDEANALMAKVDSLRSQLKKAGWETSVTGIYGREKFGLDANMSQDELKKRFRAANIQMPQRLSENELILILAETGEDSIAAALDKAKITWRTAKHD